MVNSEAEYLRRHGSIVTANQYSHEPRIAVQRPLTQEEVKVWNDCIKKGVLVAGVPSAIIMQLALKYIPNKSSAVTTLTPSGLIKKGTQFFFGCFIGLFFYSPVCFHKLKEKYLSTEKMLQQQKLERSNVAGQDYSRSDDTNFLSNLDPKLDGVRSDFSHLNLDFESSFSDKNLINENELEPSPVKKPDTTYDELRKRNRDSFPGIGSTSFSTFESTSQRYPYASSKPTLEESQPLEKISKPKNKYGDDME